MTTLKIKPLIKGFRAPSYATLGSAAFDLRTCESFKLSKGEAITIGLGFAAEVPEGHVAILCPRSGLGSNRGLGLRNTIGVIDSDYRGEWKVTLTRDWFQPNNHADIILNDSELYFNEGDRIVQCMILPVEQVNFTIVNSLSETERGTGGYGSTGTK